MQGTLAILKDLRTQKEMQSEVKLTYQYVLDLRDRLEKTSELALEHLRQASESYKHHYDKKLKLKLFGLFNVHTNPLGHTGTITIST